jgi:hypothetical protein
MCNFVETISTIIGPYVKLLVNAGRYFAGNVLGNYLARKGLGRRDIKAVHPEANGCCERFIRLFLQSLVKLGARKNNWILFLDAAKSGYNYSWHSTIRMAPIKCHEFCRNRENQVHYDAMDTTMKQRERMVKGDNQKDFQVGDMVYIIPRLKSKLKKTANIHFTKRKLGPGKIIAKLPENKINVEFERREFIAYAWEATKIKNA